MKASDSTNSLTGLTDHIEVQIEENGCFICLEELNDKQEPLVDSTLLRTCGCRFKVHPACWNAWMKDKSEFDCPICRKKSLTAGKSPVPPMPAYDWPTEHRSLYRRPLFFLVAIVLIVGASIMIYEMVNA
jgi:hypothetical protein